MLCKDPKSVADFVPLTENRFSMSGAGYACVKVPDALWDMEPGTNATFQLRYASDYDTPSYRSFFVCADITYVEPNDVDFPFPFVNTTDLELEPQPPKKKKKPEEPKPPDEEEWSPIEKKKFVFEEYQKFLIGVAGCLVVTGIALGLHHAVQKWKRRPRPTEATAPCRCRGVMQYRT